MFIQSFFVHTWYRRTEQEKKDCLLHCIESVLCKKIIFHFTDVFLGTSEILNCSL